MEIKILVQILNGDIDPIDQINVRDISLLKNNVHVQPKHVKKMLLDFLEKKISSHDLNKWAEFICLRGEYNCVPPYISPSNANYDKIADYYEDMMYVIQKLSTPEIDGKINEKNVKQYLKELDKYKMFFEKEE